MKLLLVAVLVALVVFAVVTMRPFSGTAEPPVVALAPTAPVIATALATTAPATPTPLPVASPDAQHAAVTAFPELADANSPLNREFRQRYETYAKSDLGFFADPNWPSRLAAESAQRTKTSAPATPRKASYRGPTFTDVLKPICDRVFSTSDIREVLGSAIEVNECQTFFTQLRQTAAVDAARRVCLLLGSSVQDARAGAQRWAKGSTALGGTGREFGAAFSGQWKQPVAARAPLAAEAMRHLESVEATESWHYSEMVQSGIAHLLEVERVQALERSAIAIGGSVAQTFEDGALVSLGNEAVFVAGLAGVIDHQRVRLLAHRDGIFRYVSVLGATKTVEKYQFYRMDTDH